MSKNTVWYCSRLMKGWEVHELAKTSKEALTTLENEKVPVPAETSK